MADVVAPREVLGMQMLQKEVAVGPPPDMATVLRSTAEKSLQEGRTKKALENLKDPGKTLDTAKMVNEYKAFVQEDEIDTTTTTPNTLKKSTDQVTRMQVGEKAIEDIKKFVENKRYDSIITDTATKDSLKKNLTDYLINNPAFLAIKQLIDPTFDVTSAGARASIEADAVKILQDPLLFDGLKSVTADYLATTSIDYKELQKLLKQKMELSKEITTLTTEIGTGGTSGSALTKAIEDIESDLKQHEIYTDPSHPSTIVKGAYAIQKETYHNEELSHTSEKKKYETSISRANSVFQQILEGSITTFPVYDPISKALVNINKTTVTTFLDRWSDKVSDLSREIEESKLKQTIIDQEKTKKTADLAEKKAEKLTKENLKKQKEQTLKALEEGTLDAEQKKVKDQEEAVSKRAQGLLSEAATNLWVDMSAEADKARTEKLKGLEGDAQKMAMETQLKEIYSTKNKEYDIKKLKLLRNKLTTDGVEKFGISRIDSLITSYSGTGATPEQQKLVPILKGIKDDPVKLKEFSTTLVKDMLGTIAYKKPKLLEKLFTEDEAHMKGLLGDVLPDLILKAYEDTSARGKIDEMFGKKMTKSAIGEKFKGLLKTKGFWAIFAILAALGIFLTVKATTGG